MLSKKVTASIESIVGLPMSEICNLPQMDEIQYVEKRNKRKLSFSKKRDCRKIGRGNPLLARRRLRTIEYVDRRLSKVRWR